MNYRFFNNLNISKSSKNIRQFQKSINIRFLEGPDYKQKQISEVEKWTEA